jgi:methyl-accepting chemotaxis protein
MARVQSPDAFLSVLRRVGLKVHTWALSAFSLIQSNEIRAAMAHSRQPRAVQPLSLALFNRIIFIMSTMKISTGLAIFTGGLCLLLASAGIFGLISLSQVNEALHAVYGDRTIPASQLSEIRGAVVQSQNSLLRALNDPRPRNVSARMMEVASSRLKIDEAWANYMTTNRSPADVVLATRFTEAREQLVKGAIQPAGEALLGGDLVGARRIIQDVMPTASESVLDALSVLTRLQAEAASAEHRSAERKYLQFRSGAIGVTSLAVLLSATLGWILSRRILRSLGAEPVRVKVVADAIGGGNFGPPILLREGDSTSAMAALVRMRDNLAKTALVIHANADEVAAASTRIGLECRDLSDRAEEQAGILGQAAAAIAGLNSAAKENAESTAQACHIAQSTVEDAMQGKRIVSQIAPTMRAIGVSSRRTLEIIPIADGIALEMNLLALKAAVVAARAGVPDSGLAAVVTEVRELAQRAAVAAKEMRILLPDSAEAVEHGIALAEEADKRMGEIAGSITRVAETMVEVRPAIATQSTVIHQVCAAVVQIDQATQQGVVRLQQSATAAENMKTRVDLLVSAASVLGANGSAPVPAHAGAAPLRQIIDQAKRLKEHAAIRLQRLGPTGTSAQRTASKKSGASWAYDDFRSTEPAPWVELQAAR